MSVDWLKAAQAWIYMDEESIYLRGKRLPAEIVQFRSVPKDCETRPCDMIRMDNVIWYSKNWQVISDRNETEREMVTGRVRIVMSAAGEVINMVQNLEENGEGVIRHLTCSDDFSENVGDKESSMKARIEEYVNNLETLTVDQRIKVQEVFLRNSLVFSDSPGCTHVYEHVITPTVAKPYVKKSYPVPIHQRNAVSREINRMLALGIIERSASEFCNPLRLVTKKVGMCVSV